MSLNIANEKCAVCKAYLFAEDDIVYCPECGAPHHRDCYNSIGHCALREFHGTENQYQKPEQPKTEEKPPVIEDTVFCNVCGEKYNKSDIACPSCHAPNVSRMGGHVISIDLSGGVADDTDLGDGVTASEAKKFVAVNTHRYMPKFVAFKNGKRASWNWLALLTPCGWLLSRKMYLLGAIVGALQIAFTMLGVPFAAAINQLDLSQAKNYMEISNIVLENISIIGMTAIFVAFIGSVLNLITRIIIAVFGDFIYRNRVISVINETKQNNTDKELVFRKKGGVSFIIGVLGYLAISELPQIIAYTLGML